MELEISDHALQKKCAQQQCFLKAYIQILENPTNSPQLEEATEKRFIDLSKIILFNQKEIHSLLNPQKEITVAPIQYPEPLTTTLKISNKNPRPEAIFPRPKHQIKWHYLGENSIDNSPFSQIEPINKKRKFSETSQEAIILWSRKTR